MRVKIREHRESKGNHMVVYYSIHTKKNWASSWTYEDIFLSKDEAEAKAQLLKNMPKNKE